MQGWVSEHEGQIVSTLGFETIMCLLQLVGSAGIG